LGGETGTGKVDRAKRRVSRKKWEVGDRGSASLHLVISGGLRKLNVEGSMSNRRGVLVVRTPTPATEKRGEVVFSRAMMHKRRIGALH